VPTPAQRRLDRYAVVAFATSLPGLVPIAAVLGLVALSRIRRSGTRGRGLAIAALVICGCWLIAFGVAAALNLYGERRAGIGRTTGISQVKVQQCFDADLEVDTLRQVRIADCAAAHSGEAYAKVRATLTGLSTEQKGAAATQQCATAFQTFVGKPYERSELDMYYVVLEDRAVADGNVLCMVGKPGEQLTGSMRGSQR
jgi:chloramphenicol 3-O-phosphotransferase